MKYLLLYVCRVMAILYWVESVIATVAFSIVGAYIFIQFASLEPLQIGSISLKGFSLFDKTVVFTLFFVAAFFSYYNAVRDFRLIDATQQGKHPGKASKICDSWLTLTGILFFSRIIALILFFIIELLIFYILPQLNHQETESYTLLFVTLIFILFLYPGLCGLVIICNQISTIDSGHSFHFYNIQAMLTLVLLFFRGLLSLYCVTKYKKKMQNNALILLNRNYGNHVREERNMLSQFPRMSTDSRMSNAPLIVTQTFSNSTSRASSENHLIVISLEDDLPSYKDVIDPDPPSYYDII